MNSKRCVDGSELSEHKKHMNVIHFEFKRFDVAISLNYLKHTYSYKMTGVQVKKPLRYNFSFISMVGSSGSRLEPYILQFRHVKIQALITYHLISKSWGGLYLYHVEYDLP